MQQPAQKKHLTVVCYWQNYEASIFSRISSAPAIDGCERYKDPTHCERTAAEMFGDAAKGGRDWERVTADNLIYTISCKHNCKKLPVMSQSYDADTDGKWMWITFESPDNKNLVEIFEIYDISKMKEETAAPAQPSEGAAENTGTKVGTGFFVSDQGHILTNAHVVSGCRQIQTRDGRLLRLVSSDKGIDLALLKVEGEVPAVATFRLRPAPRVGDSVVTFGFPLQGILSSEGNLTTGTVAAKTGLGDDPRFMQVSAPVQPGSSGSPLLDSGGDVVGVMESKLDAAKIFQIVEDIPENVTFAIQASETTQFLERNHVSYRVEATATILDLKVADVAAKAKQFSLPIECIQ
ncbi:MAG TPA: serine protease [Candidatus Sulfotelmatobacter sp.]|nr:serine protease [Candidatus Sulfotelmatobacter sp.]